MGLYQRLRDIDGNIDPNRFRRNADTAVIFRNGTGWDQFLSETANENTNIDPVGAATSPSTLKQWALDQQVRLPYFARIARSLFVDMDNGSVNLTTLLQNAVDIMNDDTPAFNWFIAYKIREGIAGTSLTSGDISSLTAAQRQSLLQLIYDFVNGGGWIGLAGAVLAQTQI